jgi:hypothetical protein
MKKKKDAKAKATPKSSTIYMPAELMTELNDLARLVRLTTGDLVSASEAARRAMRIGMQALHAELDRAAAKGHGPE